MLPGETEFVTLHTKWNVVLTTFREVRRLPIATRLEESVEEPA